MPDRAFVSSQQPPHPGGAAAPLPGAGAGKDDGTPIRAAQWWRDPLRLRRLRDHPEFDLSLGADPTGPPEQHEAALQLEAGRDPSFERETVRLFRERLGLVSLLGLMLVPLFTLFYWLFSPEAARAVLLSHLGLMFVSLGVRGAARQLHSVRALRALTLGGYTLFCLITASVTAQLSALPSVVAASDGARAVELAALAAQSQIVISLLLLPLVLWEAALISALVTGALGWALWHAKLAGHEAHLAQLFVLDVSALLILGIAHLQCVMRRAAFNAAFDLAQTAALMKAQSVRDEVTGGFNRRHLEALLAAELARATRFGHPLSLLMFDLDGFKNVNDTHGHVRGDDVLREVLGAALEVVREVDTVARYGGDEFMVLLPETDNESAVGIAERMRLGTAARLCHCWGDEGPESRVTLSLGVVTLHPSQTSESVSLRQLLARADERLYAAKRLGKNRVAH